MTWCSDNILIHAGALQIVDAGNNILLLALPREKFLETDGYCFFSHRESNVWYFYCVLRVTDRDIAQKLDRECVKELMIPLLPNWMKDKEYDVYWINGNERILI